MACKDSDLHCHDHCPALTQTYYFSAETSLMWSCECFCLFVDRNHSSARFDFHSQHSSQERPTKILTTLPQMPSCT